MLLRAVRNAWAQGQFVGRRRCSRRALCTRRGLGAVFARIFDGRNAYTTDTVERVLGRPAGDFTAYVRRAATSGAWSLQDNPEVMFS